MLFDPKFILLQQEAYLAHGSLSAGLTALRNAAFPNKANFYLGFFNTSIAFERIMKLIIITDHMLQNSFQPPSKIVLKRYGHDLVSLYGSCVSVATRIGISKVSIPASDSIENQILGFLSNFADGSRYHNLDSISSIANNGNDPLALWDMILKNILNHDVPKQKFNIELQKAIQLSSLMAGKIHAIQHGMDGKLLSESQVFEFPAIHKLAVPYSMVRLFNLIIPLLKTLNELGQQGHYASVSTSKPLVPLFGEFFVHFNGTPSQIRQKKRWP